jgi:hypothetical protein
MRAGTTTWSATGRKAARSDWDSDQLHARNRFFATKVVGTLAISVKPATNDFVWIALVQGTSNSTQSRPTP